MQAGCEVISTEKASGKSRDGRDELARIMDFLREDDELVVVKLDRLGRSTRDVLNLVHELEAKGAALTVLRSRLYGAPYSSALAGVRTPSGCAD